MIDNLEGGTISLEHSYVVGPMASRVGHETIYEGMQDPFERPVWIHVYDFLNAEPTHQGALTARQLRAAERSREVDSFGLLLAVDHGELEEGVPFLITERCSGPDLHDVLEREGTLSPEETAQLVLRLADLVDPLHRHNRYHGSIAPQWVFLPDEEMGAARLGHTHLSLSLSELQSIHSELPFELLSVMAPELLAEDAPSGSRAADIYALGIIAYKCLAGTHPAMAHPQSGAEALHTLEQANLQPLTDLGADQNVSDVIMRALEQDPGARWSNAPAFGQALCRAAGLFEPEPEAPVEPVLVPSQVPSVKPTETQATPDDEDFDELISTDRRALVTGLALLALLASNGLWLVWTLSQDGQSVSSSSSTFATLKVSSDAPQMSILELSGEDDASSELGETPLALPLPKSDVPLKLELREGASPTDRAFRLELLQSSSPPTLELHLKRPERIEP